MIGFYNYTVILTYIGTAIGFTGMAFAAQGNIKAAIICLMAACLCDMFDGKIASTKKSRTRAEKRFGVQIDSLSDVICFGVLPAMIMYSNSDRNMVFVIPCAIYMLCALIRLAYFNVDEEERQDREGGRRTVYLGMPVTFAGYLVPFFMGLFSTLNIDSTMRNVCPWLLLIMGAAFLTPFHLKKPNMVKKIIMGLVAIACVVLVTVGMSFPGAATV